MRRRPVSQYAAEYVGVATYENGELADPDGDAVTVSVLRDSDGAIVVNNAPAIKDDTGLFSYQLTSNDNAVKGDYTVTWNYVMNTQPRSFIDTYTVTDSMTYWDSLSADERNLVNNVYHKVSDTFDSMEGGPYLWELYQTQWNAFETIAQLMVNDAITYINFTYQPAFIPPFVVGTQEGKKFPPAWYGLLERAGYVEFLRHLSRSYIEQPQVVGVNAGRLERRDYRDRWLTEWRDEKETLDSMLKQFKRKFLTGGTRRAMILAGGSLPRLAAVPGRPSWRYAAARY